MGRTTAEIFNAAINGRSINHVYELTRGHPTERSVSRATITEITQGRQESPSPRVVTVLCWALGLDENEVRAEMSRPKVSSPYVGAPKSAELTPTQRQLLNRMIDHMVDAERYRASRGERADEAEQER